MSDESTRALLAWHAALDPAVLATYGAVLRDFEWGVSVIYTRSGTHAHERVHPRQVVINVRTYTVVGYTVGFTVYGYCQRQDRAAARLGGASPQFDCSPDGPHDPKEIVIALCALAPQTP